MDLKQSNCLFYGHIYPFVDIPFEEETNEPYNEMEKLKLDAKIAKEMMFSKIKKVNHTPVHLNCHWLVIFTSDNRVIL